MVLFKVKPSLCTFALPLEIGGRSAWSELSQARHRRHIKALAAFQFSQRPGSLSGPKRLKVLRGTFSPSVMAQGGAEQPRSEDDDIVRTLFLPADIREAVESLGRKLALEYQDKAPVVLCNLKGSFIFTADLVRAMKPCPLGLQVDFVDTSSYGAATVSSGTVVAQSWGTIDLAQRHVILFVVQQLKTVCSSIKTAVLLEKTSRRVVDIKPDFFCFECPNEFVVGYGLDFGDRYRSLDFVGVLKEEVVNEAKN